MQISFLVHCKCINACLFNGWGVSSLWYLMFLFTLTLFVLIFKTISHKSTKFFYHVVAKLTLKWYSIQLLISKLLTYCCYVVNADWDYTQLWNGGAWMKRTIILKNKWRLVFLVPLFSLILSFLSYSEVILNVNSTSVRFLLPSWAYGGWILVCLVRICLFSY